MLAISLYELHHSIRHLLEFEYAQIIWVRAEIAEMRLNSKGFYSLNLVEKEEGKAGGFRAKANAVIWANVAQQLLPKFEQTAGSPLQAGMKVLVAVKVNFHEAFGYSLFVQDIDPSYTLGELTQQRNQILRQLEADGVLHLNQELVLPRIVHRVAIISAAEAAGYGDFMQHLQQSGYSFTTRLFPAVMQGTAVESSVISALNTIASQTERWDCVVIIRGGGASTDLSGFDTYLLAANVAQFPLPILTGIGHERDESILDKVAHTRCKTPTAVASWLIDLRNNAVETLNQLTIRLENATARYLEKRSRNLQQLTNRYLSVYHSFIFYQSQRLSQLHSRLQLCVQEFFLHENGRMKRASLRLSTALYHLIEQEEHYLNSAEKTLILSDPQRIITQGYSITCDIEGRVVRSVEQLPEGSILLTQLADGTLRSRIVK